MMAGILVLHVPRLRSVPSHLPRIHLGLSTVLELAVFLCPCLMYILGVLLPWLLLLCMVPALLVSNSLFPLLPFKVNSTPCCPPHSVGML